jgi:hypothetical protein
MRFPPNWSMELVLVVALFVSILVVLFALMGPPGDRTSNTLERSDANHFFVQRRVPPAVEETAPGR